MDLKGLTINFLGDSITEGKGVLIPENCFADSLFHATIQTNPLSDAWFRQSHGGCLWRTIPIQNPLACR